ncbi:MAG: phosphotransferase [Acidimicrobiales bacterium]|jgi:aminoglycoside phosphotransferase (APT) family kinase protein
MVGPLIASGRDADIFEYGHGRVLRRSRNDRSMVAEARTMEFVRTHGYPSPRVFDVSDDGLDLVMERIDGPTMVDAGATRPWRLRAMGRELAELHQLLHRRLPAPDWVPAAPVGTGDRMLHMDLHPLNVLMGQDGPVVIDWTGAARGEPLVDVAATWLLVASGQVPTGRVQSVVLEIGRRIFLGSFLGPFPMDVLESILPEVVEWKCADPNMSAGEIERMRSLR